MLRDRWISSGGWRLLGSAALRFLDARFGLNEGLREGGRDGGREGGMEVGMEGGRGEWRQGLHSLL